MSIGILMLSHKTLQIFGILMLSHKTLQIFGSETSLSTRSLYGSKITWCDKANTH